MFSLNDVLAARLKVVVKIGTSLLADTAQGVNRDRIDRTAESVAHLRSMGVQVAIVSSGAIGAGIGELRLGERPKTIPEKQAAAAVGQPILMEAYEHAFRKQNLTIAQILLTKDDFVNRSRYLNVKNTFAALFERGIIPIINENDTVAVEEIKLGDNDNLSALVANLVEAGLLIILSDVDGLYSDDPTQNSNAKFIPLVEKITPQIERLAKKRRSEFSTGGMITKLEAAKQSIASGIAVIITNGTNPQAIEEIISGTYRGTLFLPLRSKLNVRKKWIGFVSDSKGTVVVDEGAKRAIVKRQKSLLPSGVVDVRGEFAQRDTITVLDDRGNEVAKGISGFSSLELIRIKGKKTAEIRKILNRTSGDEVIHRNNLVLTGEE